MIAIRTLIQSPARPARIQAEQLLAQPLVAWPVPPLARRSALSCQVLAQSSAVLLVR
jgi:hypothetical protein